MLDRALRFARQSAFASGIRSTAATLVPLFIGVVTGQVGFWMQVAIGGMLVASADVGGTNRNKATVMIAATIAGAITCVLGTLAGSSIWLAVPLMFAVAFCGGMTNAFDNRATAVGTIMVMAFVFRLAAPNTPAAGLERTIGFLIGGAWAMALSLWLWPTRPYQVAAEAIETFYRQLAVYIGAVGDGAASAPSAHQPEAEALRRAVEAAHTQARKAIVAVRATLTGQSAIGQRLILLSSSGDSLFHAVVGLKEEAAIAASHPGFGALAPKLRAFTQALSAATDQIASAVAAHGGNVDGAVVQSAARDVDATITALTRLSSAGDPKIELPNVSDLRNLAQACAYAAVCAQAAMDCVRVRSGSEHAADGIAQASTPIAPNMDWRAVASKIRDNLTLQSLPFRHALRLAVAVSLGVFIYKLFNSDHGYWLPLAVVMIMKPNFGATRKRATEAALGTIIGGAIATALSILVVNDYVQIALMVPLGLVAFAAMPRSYVQYVTLFTPFFILMIDIMSPGNWMFGLERIGYMIGGAILSVLAANLLWPSWERDHLPQQLGRTVNANRAYLSAVLSAFAQPPGDKAALHETLERANLENVNAEASFQRLVSEPKSQQGDIAPAYALVTYNQRIFDGITALAMRPHDASDKTAMPGLSTIAGQMDASLGAIAQVLQTGKRATPVLVQQMATLTATVADGNQVTPDAGSMQSELTRLAQAITDMARLEAQMTAKVS